MLIQKLGDSVTALHGMAAEVTTANFVGLKSATVDASKIRSLQFALLCRVYDEPSYNMI